MNLSTNVMLITLKFHADINNHFKKVSKNILQVIHPNKIKISLSKALTDIDLTILAPIGMLNNNTLVQSKLIKITSYPKNL